MIHVIHVDVITGFLGSGKTTLIKKIIGSGALEKEKVFLIENEFGVVGIDQDELSETKIEIVEISKGCICCTLKSNFIDSLIDIADRYQPDRILFEPSGIFIIEDLLNIFEMLEISVRCILILITKVVDDPYYQKIKPAY